MNADISHSKRMLYAVRECDARKWGSIHEHSFSEKANTKGGFQKVLAQISLRQRAS